MTKIYHANLYGLRTDKYKALTENTVKSTDFQVINPQSPFYLFIPQDRDLLAEYDQYFKITDIIPVNVLGFQTHRDHLALDFELDKISQRFNEMRDEKLSDAEYSRKYDIKDNRDWQLKEARTKIKADNNWQSKIITCLYRPFDWRYCYYSTAIIDRPRGELINHVAGKDNLCLMSIRQMQDQVIYSHVLVSKVPAIDRSFACSRGAASIFPLYLYPDTNKPQELQPEKRPNFSQDFLKKIKQNLGYLPTPETIFYYIYAIFHSPTYRTRYAEFLKIDFPRVPLTTNNELFCQLAEYGQELVALHLMKSPQLNNLITEFTENGGGQIVDSGYPKYIQGAVVINKKGDKFTGVPEEVWNFYIGGYQVCQKWLKDRKGRTLNHEDILHYQRVVVALQETIKLMQLIDQTILCFPVV
ncbi:hypothetical protein NWP21_03125 [Anabaenopsis sp. FSS-46]|uniref:type ISP restriction/modification enzyme n=1 Tax=Anabaenopsis sp. FSS-46 TaxID=2971766 RepID=UPI002476E01A|nr:type ISP restriction/modification enzyme [Anabaenopsis sp. FSS-46]MDH6097851.1 hypothetical protein [Anabaenopsis sp. FSS-46]